MTSYQLKVTLMGIKPPIWRRFAVPGEITLDRLHDVIQIVMGWQDHHLHLFTIGDQHYSEAPEEEFEGVEEGDFRLCDLIRAPRTCFGYDYDFGDGWKHTVVVEQITPVPKGHEAIIVCLDGKASE